MDPNEALKEIRQLTAALLHEEFEAAGGITAAVRLAELIEGLDEWLSRDGFLPADWRSDDEKASTVCTESGTRIHAKGSDGRCKFCHKEMKS